MENENVMKMIAPLYSSLTFWQMAHFCLTIAKRREGFKILQAGEKFCRLVYWVSLQHWLKALIAQCWNALALTWLSTQIVSCVGFFVFCVCLFVLRLCYLLNKGNIVYTAGLPQFSDLESWENFTICPQHAVCCFIFNFLLYRVFSCVNRRQCC